MNESQGIQISDQLIQFKNKTLFLPQFFAEERNEKQKIWLRFFIFWKHFCQIF